MTKNYMKSMVMFFALFFIIYTFLFIYYESSTLIELTGVFSALIESFLPIPQYLKN